MVDTDTCDTVRCPVFRATEVCQTPQSGTERCGIPAAGRHVIEASTSPGWTHRRRNTAPLSSDNTVRRSSVRSCLNMPLQAARQSRRRCSPLLATMPLPSALRLPKQPARKAIRSPKHFRLLTNPGFHKPNMRSKSRGASRKTPATSKAQFLDALQHIEAISTNDKLDVLIRKKNCRHSPDNGWPKKPPKSLFFPFFQRIIWICKTSSLSPDEKRSLTLFLMP